MHACWDSLHACEPQEPKQEDRPHRDKSECLTVEHFVNSQVRQSCSACTIKGHLCLLQARQLQKATQEIRLVRAPAIGEGYEHLTPSDDLNFTSKSWSITLDPETGKIRVAADDPIQLDHNDLKGAAMSRGVPFVLCACCVHSVCTKRMKVNQRALPHNEHHLQHSSPRAWMLNAGTSSRNSWPLTEHKARIAELTLAEAL